MFGACIKCKHLKEISKAPLIFYCQLHGKVMYYLEAMRRCCEDYEYGGE